MLRKFFLFPRIFREYTNLVALTYKTYKKKKIERVFIYL